MTTREEVGRRIREAREQLGISQGELAQRLTRQRTHAAISDIERGKTKLDVDELTELATILRKDLSYFYEERPAPSVLYRRGDQRLPEPQQKATDLAIEDFKRRAREELQRRLEDEKR